MPRAKYTPKRKGCNRKFTSPKELEKQRKQEELNQKLHVAIIHEPSQGAPLERPLYSKRRRLKTPTSPTKPSTDPGSLTALGPSLSPIFMESIEVEEVEEPEIGVANEVTPTRLPPSPTLTLPTGPSSDLALLPAPGPSSSEIIVEFIQVEEAEEPEMIVPNEVAPTRSPPSPTFDTTSPTKSFSEPVPLPAPGPSSSEIIVEFIDMEEAEEPEMGVANEVIPTHSTEFPPSSTLNIAEMASDVASTSRDQSFQSRSFQRRRRRLRDAYIKATGNYGSEGESSSDEEDEQPSVQIPRVLQEFMDTPEDDAEDEARPPSPIENHTIARTADTMLPHDFFDFQWESFPNPPISPNVRREVFTVKNVGPQCRSNITEPYLIFREIWDEEIMGHIVKQTNIYAQQVAAAMFKNNTLGPRSRISEWKDTDEDELLVYFAIILAMGVVVKSKIVEYWTADGSIFVTPVFSTHMTLRRFQLLNSCLHFRNNLDMCDSLSPSEAKMFKIAPIIEHCNKRFQALFVMKQNLALDESLLQWKGWLSINQFISNKAATVGIKTYELCDSETGYLWRFEVHAHKTTTAAQPTSVLDASTPAIVLRLLHGLENKGYTIWMDNYYNSPALARSLKSKGFDVAGTLRTNRKFVPEELSQLTKDAMQPGQIAGCTSGDVDILVWRDQNRVATISTYHGNATTIVDGKRKPIVVADYNIMMGGVDKKDGMLAMYPVERKRTRVWYKKFFRRLLNVSVLNSYIIYKKSSQLITRPHDHRSFRTHLITSILKGHSKNQSVSLAPKRVLYFEAHSHYIMEYPPMQGKSSKKLRRKCCKCDNLTRFYCAGCNKTVCMYPCFPSIHTYEMYLETLKHNIAQAKTKN